MGGTDTQLLLFECKFPGPTPSITPVTTPLPFPKTVEELLAWTSAFIDRAAYLVKEKDKEIAELKEKLKQAGGGGTVDDTTIDADHPDPKSTLLGALSTLEPDEELGELEFKAVINGKITPYKPLSELTKGAWNVHEIHSKRLNRTWFKDFGNDDTWSAKKDLYLSVVPNENDLMFYTAEDPTAVLRFTWIDPDEKK